MAGHHCAPPICETSSFRSVRERHAIHYLMRKMLHARRSVRQEWVGRERDVVLQELLCCARLISDPSALRESVSVTKGGFAPAAGLYSGSFLWRRAEAVNWVIIFHFPFSVFLFSRASRLHGPHRLVSSMPWLNDEQRGCYTARSISIIIRGARSAPTVGRIRRLISACRLCDRSRRAFSTRSAASRTMCKGTSRNHP